MHLDAGKPYHLLSSSTAAPSSTPPHLRLVWARIDRDVDPAAVAAAKNADVVVAVVGITSELEGEEMQVNEPGFKGGDRTSLDLPEPEEELLKAVAAAGKPLVVVLTNGSALAVNWAKEHANAILDAWYPGRRRRNGRGADALRPQQSRGPFAGNLLYRRRPVAAIRRLLNEGPDLSLL